MFHRPVFVVCVIAMCLYSLWSQSVLRWNVDFRRNGWNSSVPNTFLSFPLLKDAEELDWLTESSKFCNSTERFIHTFLNISC